MSGPNSFNKLKGSILGGELDIVARFPDGEVHIQKLHDFH
jgi:hypothetical protein